MSVPEAVDAYLAEVEALMQGSFWKKQTVRTELRAHLGALATEYQLAGRTEPDAMRQAMRDLGHPSDVGKALRSSRGRDAMRRGQLPLGEVAFDRSRTRPLPPAALLVGLGTLLVSSIAIVIVFAWP